MAYESIKVETRGAVGLVTLDRPQALNALNSALMAELLDALQGFDADTKIGAMVITGSDNPGIFTQAASLAAGDQRVGDVPLEERGQFLLDYIDLLLKERVGEQEGFRHVAPGVAPEPARPARGRERWVINKVRALGAWYTKGLEGGAQLRVAINSAESIDALRTLIREFFLLTPRPELV